MTKIVIFGQSPDKINGIGPFMKYEKHVFVCINERQDASRKSCGEATGLALVTAMKKQIKDNGLKIRMRAQKAGCMDICEHGPNVVVYPEGVFYGKVQLSDVPEIVESHLINNKPVERLIIDFGKDH